MPFDKEDEEDSAYIFFSDDEVCAPEPINWLIEDWIPADGGTCVIYGAKDSGKSLFATAIAIALARKVGPS